MYFGRLFTFIQSSYFHTMKIFSFICCLMFFTSVHAQFKAGEDRENFFRFGARVGANINKVNGQAYSKNYRYNFQAGGFLQFNFSRKFGLQPEVNFVQLSTTLSDDATEVYDDIFRDGTQIKAKMNYLEVPLLLNINIGPSKKVKLQFGPAYGARLSETVDSLRNNGDIFKKSDWSAVGGLWIQLPFVNISGRYKWGLTNMNDTHNNHVWKNQAVQLGVGITF